MGRGTFVKCKYYDTYAFPTFDDSIRRRGYGVDCEYVDKIICGEFDYVSWDEEKRELYLKRPRKNLNVKEFCYPCDGSDFVGEIRKIHVGRTIEYLVIDDMTVIDERKDCTN